MTEMEGIYGVLNKIIKGINEKKIEVLKGKESWVLE
jgi:hypothetical protein